MTDDKPTGVPGIEVPLDEDQPLTPRTPEELLDSAWDRLAWTNLHRTESTGSECRYVTRDQLAEFMTEAALMAIDASGLNGPVEARGPVTALLQSLRCVDVAAQNGHGGWAAVAARARSCIDRLAKDVTRFLEYPGLAVRHVSVDQDLRVTSVRVGDDGRALCTVGPLDDTVPFQRVFPLGELNAAGPVDDAVRLMVAGVSKVMVDDMVAQLRQIGALHSEVHDLQAHPEYVMEPGSVHAEPAGQGAVHDELAADMPAPTGDEDPAQRLPPLPPEVEAEMRERAGRDLCPDCHLPLGMCACS
jgi:hypothetical protein